MTGNTRRRSARGRARRPSRRQGTLSPSDLLLGKPAAGARVGGRVVAIDGRDLTLADALGAAKFRLDESGPLEIGDLVVLDARFSGRRATARVVVRAPGKAPAEGSEFSRFAAGGLGPALAARALALRVVRDFFDHRGFIEIETPIRVPSPGLDAYVDAVPVGDEWLITSPELAMKRLLVGGFPRIYQMSRVTRAGEAGAWHEGEFTMLEWYRAFSSMDAVVEDAEALVSEVVHAIAGKRSVRTAAGLVDVRPPFARLTVREAFRTYAGVADAADLAETDVDRYFQTLVDRVEPGISRRSKAVVLTEFPASQGGLARPCPHDPSVVERFEVYVGAVELSNGFGELTDPVEQRRRFEAEKGRRRRTGAPDHPIDERFLAALTEGMPPSGGNALGFDRLVALSLGLDGISGVVAFPRHRL